MNETGLPGLVIVVPEAEKERMALGRGLFRLSAGISSPYEGWERGRKDRSCRQAMVLNMCCIFICLDQEESRKHFESTAPYFVIDGMGKVLRKPTDTPKDIEGGFDFRLVDLAFGVTLRHLRNHVTKVRKALPAETDAECDAFLKELAAKPMGTFRERRSTGRFKDEQEKTRRLLKETPSLVGWLGLAALSTEVERETRLDAILDTIRPETIPFGSVLPEFVHGACLNYVEVKPGEPARGDWNVACGMGSVSSTGGRFLRFAGKKK